LVDIELDVKGMAVLSDVAVSHIHIAELDRNVALGSEHPCATGVQQRQRFVKTSKILERATPDHKYEHPITPRLTAIAAESRHLNNVTTVINAGTETLLTVVEPCDRLMPITSLELTAFCVPV
jgi:hypothetical protein